MFGQIGWDAVGIGTRYSASRVGGRFLTSLAARTAATTHVIYPCLQLCSFLSTPGPANLKFACVLPSVFRKQDGGGFLSLIQTVT
jgi:hypothetical protein